MKELFKHCQSVLKHKECRTTHLKNFFRVNLYIYIYGWAPELMKLEFFVKYHSQTSSTVENKKYETS